MVSSSVIIVTVVPCALKHRYRVEPVSCTLKARRWAHSALAKGRSVLPCNRVRPSADTPCSRSLPIAGGSGLAGRSYAPVSFLAAGQRRRTWSLRARAPDRVRVGESRRCVRVCSLRCPSASPPGHVSQGASRIVGLGDGFSTFLPNRARPFRVQCAEAVGTAFMMRSGRHRPGRIAFSVSSRSTQKGLHTKATGK